jgi:hypothetical protein
MRRTLFIALLGMLAGMGMAWAQDAALEALLVPPSEETGTPTETPTETPADTASGSISPTSTAWVNGTVKEEMVPTISPTATWTESLTPEVETLPPTPTVPLPPMPESGVFPNPARGAKVTFRFQSQEVFRYQVEVLDRFGDPVTLLEAEGNGLMDVVWPLEEAMDGLYYYQMLATHPPTGTLRRYPVGRLVVEKDPALLPVKKRKK